MIEASLIAIVVIFNNFGIHGLVYKKLLRFRKLLYKVVKVVKATMKTGLVMNLTSLV